LHPETSSNHPKFSSRKKSEISQIKTEMERSLSEFEVGGAWIGTWVGWCSGKTRQDKTRQDSRQEGLTFICSPTFFLAKKEHHPQTKIRFELRDLKPALRSQENQFLKSNLSGTLSLAHQGEETLPPPA
jgi:hypothetical protein